MISRLLKNTGLFCRIQPLYRALLHERPMFLGSLLIDAFTCTTWLIHASWHDSFSVLQCSVWGAYCKRDVYVWGACWYIWIEPRLMTHSRVAVCCSSTWLIQCVAVCCSVLQCVAVCYMTHSRARQDSFTRHGSFTCVTCNYASLNSYIHLHTYEPWLIYTSMYIHRYEPWLDLDASAGSLNI